MGFRNWGPGHNVVDQESKSESSSWIPESVLRKSTWVVSFLSGHRGPDQASGLTALSLLVALWLSEQRDDAQSSVGERDSWRHEDVAYWLYSLSFLF